MKKKSPEKRSLDARFSQFGVSGNVGWPLRICVYVGSSGGINPSTEKDFSGTFLPGTFLMGIFCLKIFFPLGLFIRGLLTEDPFKQETFFWGLPIRGLFFRVSFYIIKVPTKFDFDTETPSKINVLSGGIEKQLGKNAKMHFLHPRRSKKCIHTII